MKEPAHPILAQGKVRYVGDHVAMVVAETLEQARNAAELVHVDYDVLPSVVDVRDAAKATALHEVAPDNHCYKWAIGDKAQVDAAFAKAAHVTKLDLINNRLVPNPMEPRAAIGSYNRANDEYTLHVSNQNPHVERLLMTAFVMGLPEHKVRVIAPDVGGGFGPKLVFYPEEVILALATRELRAPAPASPRSASCDSKGLPPEIGDRRAWVSARPIMGGWKTHAPTPAAPPPSGPRPAAPIRPACPSPTSPPRAGVARFLAKFPG